MTVVPPPASPAVRIRLNYTQSDAFLAGSRFYLGYAGSAPTTANCQALATAVAAAWATDLAPVVNENYALTEVDVIDITTDLGNSGGWTGSNAGTRTGLAPPAQCAVNVEFDIGRRYRGGKPRIFMPPANTADQEDAGRWNSALLTAYHTAISGFFAALEAESIGAMGQLTHVNLSYYQGFKNITNSSGRERAVPQYRTAALVDTITGYAVKAVIGSQRRRRVATTS